MNTTKENTMDLQAKYDKAMDLLNRASEKMDEPQAVPDANWLGEYYTLTGDHMICTEEGWEPGEGKAEYMKDPDFDSTNILMEVNAPQ
jgi:hypothetical protein